MNSTHDNDEHDRSLNETLDKLGQTYAQVGTEEPPELLDMAILNSARRALERKPQWLKFGWLHGLTTAAVFVLALSLIINQREQQAAVDNAIQADKLEPTSLASPAKKQTSDSQTGQLRQAAKESAELRMEQRAPGVTAPASPSQTQALGDALQEFRPSESAVRAQQSDAAVADGARSNIDAQAEEQLQTIINMKQSGDKRWEAELKTFIESHPGYPLPDELKN